MRRTRLNSSVQNLRFGSLGNGVTVYDVTRQNPDDKHDYLTVAHIDDTGMIRYNAEVSEDERKAINDYAIKQQKKWLDNWESKNALTRLQILQDKADTATLLAMGDDRKSGKVGIIEDVLDKYTAPVFFDSLVKYGYEYPDNPSFNSSRRINSNCHSLKTRMAVRHSINSARRRANLNCGVTRYAGDEEYQTYYFITGDNSFVASFDVEIHEDVIEFAGFMRGYSAGGYVVNENSVFGDFAPGTDVAQALADFVYDKTGVDVYETEDAKEFINQLRNINTVFINSRRASLKSSRRLNSGKLFYDDATGEYEEYE